MKSEITQSGLPDTLPFYGMQNYVYGLSDFWRAWFEDQEVLERTLEASSYLMSDIYSKFIQACSSTSLFDIAEVTHSNLRLLLIEDDEIVTGAFAPTYKLKEGILNARYLLDLPIVPKVSYENEVHFNLSVDGKQIEFFKPLSEMGFPSRKILKNNVEVTQYSLWITDAEIDEQSLYNYFGKLVRISPQTSTKVYKDYIQGLFFLYTNGPTLDLLVRGIHLALGIPVARDEEEVLLIRTDSLSGNYIVVTENNSYLLPYGITPSVEEGDILVPGVELSQVAVLTDYVKKDNWWVNIRLPQVLFPSASEAPVAYPGSFEDYVMRTYLKHHTFLVQITLSGNLDTKSALEILRLVSDAKPSYTMPIYIWLVPVSTDDLLEDDPLEFNSRIDAYDNLLYGEYLTRDHAEPDIAGERDVHIWIRSNGNLLGYTGDVVDTVHIFKDSINGTTDISVSDVGLLPLYNLNWLEMKEVLNLLSISVPVTIPTHSFLIPNVNLVGLYDEIVLKRVPLEVPGISYNLKDLVPWEGEVLRVFTPGVSNVTTNETLAVTYACEELLSLYIYRPGGQTLFNPVYFPPAEEDPLEVTQIPA